MTAAPLAAQGVTTAAIRGTVLGPDGTPIAAAAVQVTNLSTGERWQAPTSTGGHYFLQGVAVGGPYGVEVRGVGFRPARQTGITLQLGERYVADFVLEAAAVELDPVTVEATANAGRGTRIGPTEIVSDSALTRLPTISHNFADLAILSPGVVLRPGGGVSIGSQNQSYNSIHIDGGENGDPYYNREPGGAVLAAALPQVLPRTISLEAVREFQVLVTPFDVREGGAAGGLLSAVTRSGANAVRGSMFAFFANQALIGRSTSGGGAPDFTTWQFGGSVGGPIVRDRVHYFASVDFQARAVPDPGPLISDTAVGADVARIGIRYASALRFQRILADTYALDPGTLGPVNGRVPAQDLFAKLTAQIGTGSHLEVSHHYAHADRRNFLDAGLEGINIPGFSGSRGQGYYALSSVAELDQSTAQTSRLIWSALVGGRWSNELITSYERLRDDCVPNATFPRIGVRADVGQLFAGPNFTCATDTVAQDVLEVTDNVTFAAGRHLITLGTHGELLHVRDGVLLQGSGVWGFTNLDSLARGRAMRYDRGLPGPLYPAVGPEVDFHVRQVGVYAQDSWDAGRRLALTAGLRVDIPVFPDAAVTNSAVRDSLGLDTGLLPSGNALWSPRLGARYDLAGDGRTILRGGVGLIGGRPPYRWLGNAYRGGGQELQLTCVGAAVPSFDPINQPATCASGLPPPVPQINVLDPGLKFPQNLRVTLGLDRRFFRGVIGAVDFVYTRAVHELYFTDVNLGPPIAAEAGEGGRPLYGTVSNATGIATPARRVVTLGPVIRVSNRSSDRAYSISARLERRFDGGALLGAAYAHSSALDLMSPVNFVARANLNNAPLDGTLEDRRLGTSSFDTPHRLTVIAILPLPLRSWVSLLYSGASPPPFTYIVDGDVNADGIGAGQLKNDAVYVPRGRNDIQLQNPAAYDTLDAYINSEPCLQENRGRILPRNSCRPGWFGTLNARLTKTVPVRAGQSLEIGVDVFNVLNLIHRAWGQYRFTTLDPSVSLLKLVGYDPVYQRGVYRLELPPRNQVLDPASRWQAQLGVRYVF